jgi:hypothetical protein
MIVLDEQLLAYGIQTALGHWYRGTITDITQLRPATVIPDDAIPELLRTVRQPTFVTINVKDFWRRLAPEHHFCVICFALPDQRVGELPALLRKVLAQEPFRTRRQRLGKIARVNTQRIHYYTADSWAVQVIEFQGKK